MRSKHVIIVNTSWSWDYFRLERHVYLEYHLHTVDALGIQLGFLNYNRVDCFHFTFPGWWRL
ncbi:hypothetical protein MKX01_003610, partial [Papaver californicum]